MIPKSEITIVSPTGEVRSKAKAVLSSDLAVIHDGNAVISVGDEIRRILPNGQEEVFDVIDPTFYQGMGHIGAHYQVKIARKGTFAPHTGGNYTVHVTGDNSRVNIASLDQSTNVVTTNNVFQQLRDALAGDGEGTKSTSELLKLVTEMEKNQKNPGFGAAYQKFIAAAGDHMKIIGPFIPLLAKLF
jgi:hypothetical protein